MNLSRSHLFALVLISLFFLASCVPAKLEPEKVISFDSDQAFSYIEAQLEFGPRYPGSEGHQNLQNWMNAKLTQTGWDLENQEQSVNDIDGLEVNNIIAHQNEAADYWVMLGTHYDTRQFSDEETGIEKQQIGVPGANDGASGTAVLLSLSHLPLDSLNCQISLAFFDREDQGNINGQVWSYGANYYVENHPILPDEVIIIDMIGDEDLTVYKERNSTEWLTNAVWQTAQQLGEEDKIIPEFGYSMIDDHLPFINANTAATLLIDFDYPYWHTNQDTIDHVSKDSLNTIGNTLVTYLLNHPECNPNIEQP